MRRSSRLIQSSDSLLTQKSISRYICPSCRRNHLAPYVQSEQRRHVSDNSLPWTEKVRRKIWGTDNPPGLPDPYGGPSFLERRRAEREGRTLPEPGQVVSETSISQSTSQRAQGVEAQPYLPATTWEGLEQFGGPFHWSELPQEPADAYSSFVESDLHGKLIARSELIAAIHQATVEIMTYTKHGLPASDAADMILPDEDALSIIENSRVLIAADGKSVHIEYPNGSDGSELIASAAELTEDEATNDEVTSEAAATEDEGIEHLLQAAESDVQAESTGVLDRKTLFSNYSIPHDEAFLALPLSNIELRFAFTKRLTYLTGHHFPDPVVTRIENLSSILSYLIEAANPKPLKIAEILASRNDLASLPNVTIKDRRQTWVDREKESGLWKIIEKEIQDAGLPEPGVKLVNGIPQNENEVSVTGRV